jgi:hypothetical protein
LGVKISGATLSSRGGHNVETWGPDDKGNEW